MDCERARRIACDIATITLTIDDVPGSEFGNFLEALTPAQGQAYDELLLAKLETTTGPSYASL